jgi:hypothetical protein
LGRASPSCLSLLLLRALSSKQPFFVGIKIVHYLLKINWFRDIIYILRVLSIIIRPGSTQRVNLGPGLFHSKPGLAIGSGKTI